MINIIRKADEAYKEAMVHVTNVGKTLESYYGQKGEKFDSKIFFVQFDCCLQYGLLQMAIADGKLDKEELLLLKDVTKYGDLVHFINSKYKNKLTWDNVLNGAEDSIQKWLDNNKKYMDELSNEFAAFFSLVDVAVTNEDILKPVTDSVVTLLACVASLDGNISDAERESLNTNYAIDTLAKIDYLIKKNSK